MTARHPSEGGVHQGFLDPGTRIDRIARFLPLASLIDVELSTLGDMESIRTAAADREIAVIGSFHDFESMPPLDELESKVALAAETGVDVVKIAVRIETLSELFTLARLVESTAESGQRISAMGMGRLGKLSRLVLAGAGSCKCF